VQTPGASLEAGGDTAEEVFDSVDEHLLAKYIERDMDPFKTTERLRPEFAPTGPPPMLPMAVHIDAPDASQPAQASAATALAPLEAAVSLATTSHQPSDAEPAPQPTPRQLSMVASPPPPPPPPGADGTAPALGFQASCVLALVMLGAVRLGRGAATLDAADAQRSAWLELEERQRAYEARRRRSGRAEESPAAATKRVREATRRAVAERAAREAEARRYTEQAAAEAARASVEAAVARREYEATERRKAEELAVRLARERTLAAGRAEARRVEDQRRCELCRRNAGPVRSG